ncbi:MAG: TlpA family protein disulfide reductase [Acidobacteriota bacterium]|nr:TlpA family protein disulfide reductase [Acidobacteriota bacterium]MDH3529662.1 TlpA family protein disulfide reductase [Acidobacteriota bacterium]
MNLIRTISIVLFFLLVCACRSAAPPVAVSDRPVSNNRMPRLNLPMPPSKPLEKLGWILFKGGEKKLMEEYKGKVLILDFWATYCAPCIEGIPHLRMLNEKYGDDLLVIGLHVGGEEDRPRVPAFEKRLNIDYPIATPEDELTYLLLGTDTRIPQTLVFDREGKLVEKFVSYDETIGKQIEKTVERTVKN